MGEKKEKKVGRNKKGKFTKNNNMGKPRATIYRRELGDRGYMADKWNYAFGVSYGYSLPIAKRLNLDFTLGIGYWGGRYKEYLPVEGHYVWQSTKQRHWWGPTKAEVTLVWLLGKSNFNQQKGGSR